MKTKNLTKSIFLILIMLGALWWSGCGIDEPCEPLIEIQEIDSSMFKYSNYQKKDTLKFEVNYLKQYYPEISFAKISEGIKYDKEKVSFADEGCDSLFKEYYEIIYRSDILENDIIINIKDRDVISFSISSISSYEIDLLGYENQSIFNNFGFDSLLIDGKMHYRVMSGNKKGVNNDSIAFTFYTVDDGFIYSADIRDNEFFKLIK